MQPEFAIKSQDFQKRRRFWKENIINYSLYFIHKKTHTCKIILITRK